MPIPGPPRPRRRAALERASSPGQVAACWYDKTTLTVNVNLTDGQTHEVSLYLLDFDNSGRSECVNVLDAASGTVLSSQVVSNFSGGKYLVWDVSGDVEITITSLQGPNAVLSGVFFDPVGAASLVSTDQTTGGSWQGAYGADGCNVAGDSAAYPSYAQVSSVGATSYTWAASTTVAMPWSGPAVLGRWPPAGTTKRR